MAQYYKLSYIMQRKEHYIVTTIMRTIMRQVVRANMPVCYSQTDMLDILIVTVIKKTTMGQVVCAIEATHISLM